MSAYIAEISQTGHSASDLLIHDLLYDVRERVLISHESGTSVVLYFRRDTAQQCHHFNRERERHTFFSFVFSFFFLLYLPRDQQSTEQREPSLATLHQSECSSNRELVVRVCVFVRSCRVVSSYLGLCSQSHIYVPAAELTLLHDPTE